MGERQVHDQDLEETAGDAGFHVGWEEGRGKAVGCDLGEENFIF